MTRRMTRVGAVCLAAVFLCVGCTTTAAKSEKGIGSILTPPSPADYSSKGVCEKDPRPRFLRVAGIVRKWVRRDKQRNFERVEPLIRRAAADGAQLVVTTECFLDGYAIADKSIPLEEYRALGEPIPGGPYLRRLQRLADELNILLAAGLLERDGDTMYNAAVLIGPDGRLVGKYRKQYLMHEAVRNTPGRDFPVFDTGRGKIGLIICADRRWPHLVKNIVDNGAELIVCVSGGAWGAQSNDRILQDRSRENKVPIIFVHPIEFLVTDATGEVLDRRYAGGPSLENEELDVTLEQIGTPLDAYQVAIIDLPVRQPPCTARHGD